MKKMILYTGMVIITFFLSGCATLSSMHGTYVSFTPLADRGFDSEKYEKLVFAYTPDSDNGKLFKRELINAFKSSRYKIPGERDEQDALLKTGRNYNGDVSTEDAQKLGRLLKAKAVITVTGADFSGDGKLLYAGMEITDTYGGVLVRIVHKGGSEPESIHSAAWSILNGISLENMKFESKRENEHRRRIIPEP